MCLRAYVRAWVGALVTTATGVQETTQIQGHGLLKRFTAKMPLCNCLIINKIKYFLKFFLQLMKITVTLPSETGNNTRVQKVIDIRKH